MELAIYPEKQIDFWWQNPVKLNELSYCLYKLKKHFPLLSQI